MITIKGKLNEELIDTITDHISKGNYIYVACEAAGIAHQTYDRWLRQGEEELNKADNIEDVAGNLYVQLVHRVKKAEAEAEARTVSLVYNAAPKNWLAGITWLERKYPERWGRRDAVDINFEKGVELLERLSKTLEKPQITEAKALSEAKRDSDND